MALYTGTSGNDFYTGTSFVDTIYGGTGNDSLDGADGNDYMGFNGSTYTPQDTGNDTFIGGFGADTIVASAADTLGLSKNYISGGNDDDQIYFYGSTVSSTLILSSDDTIDGGAGNDTLKVNYGGNSTDINAADISNLTSIETILLSGNMGTSTSYLDFDDTTFDNGTTALTLLKQQTNVTSNFVFYAGDVTSGNITITDTSTFTGTDIYDTGGGNDIITDSLGNNVMAARGGVDRMNGGVGNDLYRIEVDDDDDTIYDTAADSISGNDQLDITSVFGLSTNVAADCILEQKGNDLQIISRIGENFITVKNYFTSHAIESITIDAVTWDTTYVGGNLYSGTAIIEGTVGSNNLAGTSSSEEMFGFTGNDTLNGDLGADTLYGGAGADRLIGGDSLDGSNDYLYGHSGNDNLAGSLGNDMLDGGADNDVLAGDDGNDTILGGTGTDSITGGTGTDSITGGIGADTITGGTGADTIIAGNTDTVIDLVRYSSTGDGAAAGANTGYDTVSQFQSGVDQFQFGGAFNGGANDWDDITNNNDFAFTTGAANFNTTHEAMLITGISDANLTQSGFTAILAAINTAGVTASLGQDGLIVVDGSTNSALFAYQESQAGGNTAVTASELTLLAVTNGILSAGNIDFY